MLTRSRSLHMLSLIVTVTAVMAAPLLASAVSLCSQALLSDPTSQQISTTIEGIARLRLTLDQAKAQNTSSVASKKMTSNYQVRLQDLIRRMEGIYTQEQLKELIKLKISELQAKGQTGKQEESKEREIEKQKQEKRLPKLLPAEISEVDFAKTKIVFLPKTNEIIYSKDGLKRHSILENKTSVIFKDDVLASVLLPKSNHLVFLTKAMHLVKYDLRKKSIISDLELLLDGYRPDSKKPFQIILSPDLKHVVMATTTIITIFNTKTGEKMNQMSTAGEMIGNVAYISNSAFLFDGGRRIHIYDDNIKRNDALINIYSGRIRSWNLSSDRTKAIVVTDSEVVVVQLDNTAPDKIYKNLIQGSGKKITTTYVPSDKSNYVLLPQHQHDTAIYHVDDLRNPVYNFENAYAQMDVNESVVASAVSADGKKAVIIVKDENSPLLRADLWELPIE